MKKIIIVSTLTRAVGAFPGGGAGYQKATAFAARRRTLTGVEHYVDDLPWEPDAEVSGPPPIEHSDRP